MTAIADVRGADCRCATEIARQYLVPASCRSPPPAIAHSRAGERLVSGAGLTSACIVHDLNGEMVSTALSLRAVANDKQRFHCRRVG